MKHGKREAKGKLDRSGGTAKEHKTRGKRKETAKRAAPARWPLTTGLAWLAQSADAPGCGPEFQSGYTRQIALADPSRSRPRMSGRAIDLLCDGAAAKRGMPVHLSHPAAGTLRLWQIELRSEPRVLFSGMQYAILSECLTGQRLAAWWVDIGMNGAIVELLARFCKEYGFPHVLSVPGDPRLARVRRWAGRHGVAIFEILPRTLADCEPEVRH